MDLSLQLYENKEPIAGFFFFERKMFEFFCETPTSPWFRTKSSNINSFINSLNARKTLGRNRWNNLLASETIYRLLANSAPLFQEDNENQLQGWTEITKNIFLFRVLSLFGIVRLVSYLQETV